MHEHNFPKPLNFFTQKFAQMIMSSIFPDEQNLVQIRLRKRGGFPTNGWNITLAWLFVSFLRFPSLPLPYSTTKTTEPILTHDDSYDAVSRKEVPFGGYKI